jgi:salicylate hydroxylase
MVGMRVAVVGGGVAGLVFAACLRRAGISCAVYEQAEELGDVGAGIQLSPNGVRPLLGLGLGADLARRSIRPEAREIRRWRDGRVIGWTSLGAECEARFGAPYLTLRRSELHECLRSGPTGPSIELGRRCVGVRERAESHRGVELSFADGSRADADLVVGADGIRSAVRGVFGPFVTPVVARDRLRYSGSVVHRAMVPADQVPGARSRVSIFVGPGGHCVWYPVSADWYSLAAVTADPAGGARWRGPGDRDAVLAAFDGWHADVTGVLSAATDLTSWALYDRWPLTRWHARRIALIGDAAHPMLPFVAQGANQAIESAVTLATILAGGCGEDITASLARYARLRAPRLRQVSALVRRNGAELHLPDGDEQRRRDRAMSEHSGLSGQAWLYGYDAEADARGRAQAGAGLSSGPAVPVGRAS